MATKTVKVLERDLNYGFMLSELDSALNDGYSIVEKHSLREEHAYNTHTDYVIFILHKPNEPSEAEQAFNAHMANRPDVYSPMIHFEAWHEEGRRLAVKYAPKVTLSADMNVSVGNPEAFANLIRETVINNGGSLDSARDLPRKTTSFNEWYGVRDIP